MSNFAAFPEEAPEAHAFGHLGMQDAIVKGPVSYWKCVDARSEYLISRLARLEMAPGWLPRSLILLDEASRVEISVWKGA
jgi:hypothetical protein